MLKLTNSQINELLELIKRNHVLFVAQHVGVDVLQPYERSMLPPEFEQYDMGAIEQAFYFGLLSQLLGSSRAKKIKTYDQLKRLFESSQSLMALSERELASLQALQRHAYSDITGLGNKIAANFQQLWIEQDQAQRAKYESVIRRKALISERKRESVKQLVSRLGHASKDWARDFGRIADFVQHSAFDQGRAHGIIRKHGEDALVWKSVYEGACPHCIRLLTTAGVGSEPIVFKLSELIANGTNVGKKVDDWKAVVGPIHPWCRCTLEYKPDGFAWDPKTQSFNIPIATQGRKVARRSTVKVSIGDNKYEV